MINDEFIDNFINCKYKVYCKFNNVSGKKTEFERFQEFLTGVYKEQFYKNLVHKNSLIIESINSPLNEIGFVLNPVVKYNEFAISFDAMEVQPAKSNSRFYVPITISPREKITNHDKLGLAIKCILFSEASSLSIDYAKIIYGKNANVLRLKFNTFVRQAQSFKKELLKGISQIEPSLIKNDHCKVCEFQDDCRNKLIQLDDLSLLSGSTLTKILQTKNRGIFTITQLSYSFRPKKSPNLYRSKNPYKWELKALAIKDKRTYIIDTPRFTDSEFQIFVDFEGLPDEEYCYLLGVVIITKTIKKTFSFWCDDKTGENIIFINLIKLLSSYDNCSIYHYGSYEIKALKRIGETLESQHKESIKDIINRSINILPFFHTHVYPPTYSNELKEIARFLGFNWSSKNASGIQSIVWRKKWELNQNPKLKQKLLRYNLEDCLALFQVKQWMEHISQNPENVGKVSDIQVDKLYKFCKTNYLIPQLNEINKLAYFNYQREKIYFNSKPPLKKPQRSKIKAYSSNMKINQKIKLVVPEKCPKCNHTKLYRHQIQHRTYIDLKIQKDGIKRWIVQMETGRYKCAKCSKVFQPILPSSKFGFNLMAWSMNQYITYNISLREISKMLFESFNILSGSIQKFKSYLANYYKETFEQIIQTILEGNLIQIDETKIKMNDSSSGYVWAFTNLNSVFYLYRPNREAQFLHTLLQPFRGVLVSDFYAGYDSIDCLQQKCLIHLIRDLNDDLLKNQLDIEYKEIVIKFSDLLNLIMNTVNCHGLKKEFLKKHLEDVENFYNNINENEYVSALANKCKKRLEKYRSKLFTFLQVDGIPWNNNNAEYAIKRFALYRRNVDGSVRESTFSEYLVLLSIAQTCKYRNINFLEFLLSKEKDINHSIKSHLRRNKRLYQEDCRISQLN